MDFISTVMEMERDAHKLYLNLAEKTPVREIRGIFEFLAEEEMKHISYFESLARDANIPLVEDSKLTEFAAKTFEKLSEQFMLAGVPAINYEDAYEKALELEGNTIEYYSNALRKSVVNSSAQRNVLLAIIEQEKTHARLLRSVLELLGHPDERLENAEWHHQVEY